MSLPKRDGVHDRYYLIHKPDTAPEVLAEADACIQDILDGTARENHAAYPAVVRNQSGTPFLPSQLLERYLSRLPLKGFPYEEAVAFCDALRRLAGWKEIDYTLRQYIEKQVRDRYFEVGEVIAKVDPNRCDRKKAVKERGDSEKSEWGSRPHGKRREGGISE